MYSDYSLWGQHASGVSDGDLNERPIVLSVVAAAVVMVMVIGISTVRWLTRVRFSGQCIHFVSCQQGQQRKFAAVCRYAQLRKGVKSSLCFCLLS